MIELLSLIIGLALLSLHLLAAFVFFRRLRAGRNGMTLALLLHMLAVGAFIVVRLLDVHEPWLLIGRLLLLVSVVNVILSARIEAHKPLRRRTRTSDKLHRMIE